MSIPRLHLTTDDGVLADPDFTRLAAGLVGDHGPGLALHLRGRSTSARRLLDLAQTLVPQADRAGTMLLVNDRLDVALAAGAAGVHLGSRSMPPGDARSLLGDRTLGCSVHSAEGAHAVSPWIDFVFLGTIYPTPSHAGEPGAGPALVAATAARATVPILAIGGISVDRVEAVVAAGAHGVAVIRGIWSAADPAAEAGRYLEMLNASHATRRVVAGEGSEA